MSPRRATTKAIIAKGRLKVARFLLGDGASVASGFFAGGTTGVGAGGEDVFSELVTIGGGSGAGLVAAAGGGVEAGTEAEADAETAGVGGISVVVAVVARTGFGGKLSFGSFSKGAETAPSSALGDGVSVFISSRDF